MERIVYNEKNLETMSKMADNSMDSIVTDPPYGLKFMGKKWDYEVPSVEIWKECLRVLKPGGYLLAFAGTRTQHRMCCNIEDAGFEIRDMIAWIYGSGFPKSHNIGKAVDKLQGNNRESNGIRKHPTLKDTSKIEEQANASHGSNSWKREWELTKGNSKYEGWGTALKPALEPITVARKPLSEKTVAANVLKWGTGGINIDGCRVDTFTDGEFEKLKSRADTPRNDITGGSFHTGNDKEPIIVESGMNRQGRFPANLVHDGSQMVLDLFPDSKGQQGAVRGTEKSRIGDENTVTYGKYNEVIPHPKRNDSGSAARFFYCAKASKTDREEGLNSNGERLNNHPTVKPTKLMQYLVRLVTPAGGTCYDPYTGSGSTGKACKLEGFGFIGSEMGESYCEIANIRIK